VETWAAQLHEQLLQKVFQTPEEAINYTIELWEALAARLVPIIGAEGFQSLLDRSLHMTSTTFPWLAIDLIVWDHSEFFSGLKANLSQRTPAEASSGGLALLLTFVETLVALLDVEVVSNILRSAWGDHVVQR
jgi:hypothetical protein